VGGQRRRDGEVVFVQLQRDHVRTAGGQRWRAGEVVFVQLSNEITYELWVGKGGEMVRLCLCSYPTRSRTDYRWAKAERG
jgi:hypothetical protein